MKSLWNDTAKLPQFPDLQGDVKTEVLIIGGGLAGILCAYRLEQEGIPYILVEANRICRGITGNTTAKITAQHGLIYDKLIKEFGVERAKQYYRANMDAVEQYRTLCRDISCEFEEKDSYIYARDSLRELDQEIEALGRIRGEAELVRETELPFPVKGTIRFPKQAQFHPLKFSEQIAKGLNIYENTRVASYDGTRWQTGQGSITAEKTIVATYFPIWNKHGLYPLKMHQERSYVLALEGGETLEGMYLDESEGGLSFRNYDGLLLLGGGTQRTGKTGGWSELEQTAKTLYPNAKIRYRWAAQDCMTLDGVPYIGQYSKATPNLYVATGFNKWGMTSSMVAANILANLVQGKESPYGDVFSPQRTMLRPKLFSNAYHATVNLLTPTVPRCPHMGCALKWNEAEQSWDCPCHGSRFSRDGVLMEGPANGDIFRNRS